MNAGIIYISNENEANLAKAKYLDTSLLNELLKKLKNVSLDRIYLVGTETEDTTVISNNNLSEVIDDIDGHDGKTLLISPFYPLLKDYHFEALLKEKGDGVVLSDDKELLKIYKFENSKIKKYESLSYKAFKVENGSVRKINSLLELEEFSKEERIRINTKHINNGVNILDKEDTYISYETEIEKGVTVYPNVYMDGHCVIKNGAVITNGSYLINAKIGNNTLITNSRIDNSIVHNNVKIGPMAHLRMNSEVFDDVRIGNFVEFKKTKFGKGSKCAHLTYLGDTTVGENVNIGCGVVTVNYDGVNKFETVIDDHAFIGSNANLIAPITVGKYAVVAAGSTCTEDVPDNDMAIARSRQTTMKDYGYKYIKKEK